MADCRGCGGVSTSRRSWRAGRCSCSGRARSDEPDEALASYVDRYLTEEIAAEGHARNLLGFARFLQTAAVTNAQMLNSPW